MDILILLQDSPSLYGSQIHASRFSWLWVIHWVFKRSMIAIRKRLYGFFFNCHILGLQICLVWSRFSVSLTDRDRMKADIQRVAFLRFRKLRRLQETPFITCCQINIQQTESHFSSIPLRIFMSWFIQFHFSDFPPLVFPVLYIRWWFLLVMRRCAWLSSCLPDYTSGRVFRVHIRKDASASFFWFFINIGESSIHLYFPSPQELSQV